MKLIDLSELFDETAKLSQLDDYMQQANPNYS